MNTTKLERQKILAVLTQENESEYDKYEIKELIATAQGELACFVVQKRSSIDPNTIVGKGKLVEIKEYVDNLGVDLVLFDRELTALQRRNVEDIVCCDVIDKIDLILDIFAQRATTAEGKKQVELAQLTYSLANRSEKSFSRQQGGIGSRGPGESQLETDKRLIRRKIYQLKQELAALQKQRETMRSQRKKSPICVVALVGYTNVGKSTLFNLLTNNSVYADDKLFATLDTTTRKMLLPNGLPVLLCDTVGFIKDLPHSLVDAFKSTLEETVDADLILNVCDVSSEHCYEQEQVCKALLSDLKVRGEILTVYNKVDKYLGVLPQDGITISATNNVRIDMLKDLIQCEVMKHYKEQTFYFDYSQGKELGKMLSFAASYSLKTTTVPKDNGTAVSVLFPLDFVYKV